MTKELKQKLENLRQFRVRITAPMKAVDALEKELKKAKAAFE